MSSAWVWDAGRREYYYWSTQENAYVYEDGTRVSPEETKVSPTTLETLNERIKVVVPTMDPRVPVGRYSESEEMSNPAQVENREDGRSIKGTPGNEEPLDARFRIRGPGREFFRVGKVIKVIWPELAGETQSEGQVTTIGLLANTMVPIICKIRWFVVFRPGKDDCSCLPIHTYGSKGVAKQAIDKYQHAIIYTDKDGPKSHDPGDGVGGQTADGNGFRSLNLGEKGDEDGLHERMPNRNNTSPWKSGVKAISAWLAAAGSSVVLNNYPDHKNQDNVRIYEYFSEAVGLGFPAVPRFVSHPTTLEWSIACGVYAAAAITYQNLRKDEKYQAHFLLAGTVLAASIGIMVGQDALLDVLPWSIILSLALSTVIHWKGGRGTFLL